MIIDLNKPITADNMISLLLKARHCEKACLDKHGEIPTDIVADMLNADGVDITIEDYQFFLAYADYDHLDEQITSPQAREHVQTAQVILQGFAKNLHREWQEFQEFDADNEHLGFLESVNEFFQEKRNKYVDSIFAEMQKN